MDNNPHTKVDTASKERSLAIAPRDSYRLQMGYMIQPQHLPQAHIIGFVADQPANAGELYDLAGGQVANELRQELCKRVLVVHAAAAAAAAARSGSATGVENCKSEGRDTG